MRAIHLNDRPAALNRAVAWAREAAETDDLERLNVLPRPAGRARQGAEGGAQ